MAEGSPAYQPGLRWSEVDRFRPTGGSYGVPVAEGAGFEYDAATLHELAREWSDLAKEYKSDLHQADYLAKTKPPGAEYASGNNADLTQQSGAALMDALNQRIAYCEDMARKYLTALGKYATTDDHAATVVNQQPKGIL
ncbi:hypothetical protein P3102_02630 [Amycolatopsis sp. QT-25]|uniref:hypothetical protein n=1 Tax=Amycolatopsis sp. QT-25 TaxID=3034022 RepID=UPI0023EA9F2F|nr:hypothetical protein [Amycolatopsis sp. QT-25]WET80167.1 hypothetical protein P3102_02630 [Amycolatopsis sp. QT-25]